MPVAGFPFADISLGRTDSTPDTPHQANDHNLFADMITVLKNEIVDLESRVSAGPPSYSQTFLLMGG